MKYRILSLDVARGFTVLFLMSSNIFLWSGYSIPQNDSDVIAYILKNTFLEGWLYNIFALVFGASYVLFMGSKFGKPDNLKKTIWVRRLVVLFCIGLVHGIFFNSADILTILALSGYFLLYTSDDNPQKDIFVGFVLIILPIFVIAILGSALNISFLESVSAPTYSPNFSMWISKFMGQILFSFLNVLGMMYIGSGLAKTLFFIDGYLQLPIRAPLVITSSFLMLGYISMQKMSNTSNWVSILAYIIISAVLAIFMLALIVKHAHRLEFLSKAGELTLSLYITQSILANFVFYALGFHGQLNIPLQLFFSWIVSLLIAILFIRFRPQGFLEPIYRKLSEVHQ